MSPKATIPPELTAFSGRTPRDDITCLRSPPRAARSMISNAIGPIAIANVATKTSALTKITLGDGLRIAELLARDGDAGGAEPLVECYHISATHHVSNRVAMWY